MMTGGWFPDEEIMKTRLLQLSVTLVCAAALSACGSTSDQAGVQDTSAQAGAQAMPADHPPTGQGAGGLPPGHPPAGGSASALPAVPAGSGTGETGMSWDAPEGWEWVQPANSMRRAQYKVPGAAGDGECVVYYFGPGQGGDPMSNAQRWAGQFTQPDGSSSMDKLKTETIQVADMSVLMIEVTGTYGGGMPGMGGGGASMENHMLLGAVAEGPDANWFFKLTGPQETIEGQRSAFDSLIQSLKAGS